MLPPHTQQTTATASTPEANKVAFKKDIIALFKHISAGHISKWEYHPGYRGGHLETGDTLWSEFAKSSQYYIPHEEIELIKWHAKTTLAERFKHADTAIDLGSGSAFAVKNKSMPIIHGMENVKIYCLIDLSTSLLNEATKAANENINCINPFLKINAINGDFNTGKTYDGQDIKLPGKVRAGLMLGSTITNANMDIGASSHSIKESVLQNIKNPAALLGESGKGHTLTFGYDANPNLQDALTAYDHDCWRRLVVGVMLDVQNVLKPTGNFSGLAWKHIPIIDEKNHVIHQCIEATCNQDFSIDGERFSIKSGDRFVINNNFKFPSGMFRELIQDAGGTPLKTLKHPNDRMVLQTMEI